MGESWWRLTNRIRDWKKLKTDRMENGGKLQPQQAYQFHIT
jgi:hypothetical protein